MHTIEMALNLLKEGHLERCEIRPIKRGNGFKIVTKAQDGQGGEFQEVTNNYGEPLIANLGKAVDLARSIGFEENQIEIVEAASR